MALTPTIDGPIAALDVGSGKVACLIAESSTQNGVKVLGVGNRACNGGVVGGVVVDMGATEQAIRSAVDQAEKMAGQTISDVVLSFSGGDLKTTVVEVSVSVSEHAVTDADVQQALKDAKAQIDAGDLEILHAFPAAYSVDGNFGVKNPIGMYGKSLGLALLVVLAEPGPLQNLRACVSRAHLNVLDVVLAPLAAGLATLVDDEVKMGAACIDMGAGTTGISVFAQGSLVHAEMLPLGGALVTEEIARSLLTPFDQAERLKTFNGAAAVHAADERLEIEVQQVGEAGRDSLVRMPRSSLTEVMQKELELLFATIGEHLDASGFSGVAGRRVVLTGGVASCEGVRELATRVLGRKVRVGRPQLVGGLPQAAQTPGFSASVGMLLYSSQNDLIDMKNEKRNDVKSSEQGTGTLNRILGWFKETF